MRELARGPDTEDAVARLRDTGAGRPDEQLLVHTPTEQREVGCVAGLAWALGSNT